MQPSLAARLADTLEDGGWRTKARPEQLPPDGDWNGWIVMAGRGFGKTRTGAEWVRENVEAGTAKNIGLIAPTASDARDVMVEGPAGLLTISSPWCRPQYEPSKRRLTWPNGAIATTFSSEEADRLRGPQHDLLWGDEFAAWNEASATFDMAMFGLRLGRHPRWLATTTPRPIKLLRELLARDDVVVTRGTTFDNAANLAPTFLDAVKRRYQGTRLGRQELDGEILEDVAGALWQRSWFDRDRVERAPPLDRIVVAIDPAVSNKEGSDETGIIVAGFAGRGLDEHGYILEDVSGRFAPHEWAAKAVDAYRRWQADRIIAEINNGGLMVEQTIRTIAPNVPFKAVTATRGKAMRAEPVASLYEKGRVHHVGAFETLEDQMASFASDFDRGRAGYSPDRMDAAVWALTEMVAAEPMASWNVYQLMKEEYEADVRAGIIAPLPRDVERFNAEAAQRQQAEAR